MTNEELIHNKLKTYGVYTEKDPLKMVLALTKVVVEEFDRRDRLTLALVKKLQGTLGIENISNLIKELDKE